MGTKRFYWFCSYPRRPQASSKNRGKGGRVGEAVLSRKPSSGPGWVCRVSAVCLERAQWFGLALVLQVARERDSPGPAQAQPSPPGGLLQCREDSRELRRRDALPASHQLSPALPPQTHTARARLQHLTKLPRNSEEMPFTPRENHFLQLQPEPVASLCSDSHCLFSRIGLSFIPE